MLKMQENKKGKNMEKFEKVYRAMEVCARAECAHNCTGCPYEDEEDCITARNKDLLEVLETIKKQRSAGVPPMPCNVGDELWGVYGDLGQDIHIAKRICSALLWNGEEWLIDSGDCCYGRFGENCFLKLEEAVKKAEELLRHG